MINQTQLYLVYLDILVYRVWSNESNPYRVIFLTVYFLLPSTHFCLLLAFITFGHLSFEIWISIRIL